MKTKPVDSVLPIPMDSDSQKVMDIYYEALHELVSYGTHILEWSLKANQKKEPATELGVAAPLLFRHILELLDAISIQIKYGIVEPCKVQQRAALEAYFCLDYMLQEKTQERAACFYVVDFYRKLNMYRKYSPGTPKNEAFQKDLKDHSSEYSDIFSFKEAAAAYDNMKSLIERPMYAEARAEYLSLTTNNTKRLDIKWYSLFGGPTSVIWIAKKLKKYELHEFFYKSWSNASHGTELCSGTLARAEEEGYGSIKQLRNLEQAQNTVMMAINLGLLSFGLMAEKVVLKESKWTLLFSRSHNAKVKTTKLVFTDPI
ncbi:DUF5677 domain-containing protein [Spirosoma koreense]